MKHKRNFPYLRDLMLLGFQGGLKWETQARDVHDDEQAQIDAKQCRFLLHHPHSFHLAKVIVNGLKTSRPIMVSLALADIYYFAAEKISMCAELEPEDFFARAKNSFAWSASFRNQAFWAFTYKAFHARSIFVNTMLKPTEAIPTGPPLVQALDKFLDEFLAMYPIDHSKVLEKDDSRCQENIEWVEDQVSINKEIYDKYFPYHLTHYNGQGDGTDKVIGDMEQIRKSWKEVAGRFAPKEKELDLSQVPDEELFFYDTECRGKHRDAFNDDTTPNGSESLKLGERPKTRKYDAFKSYREAVEDKEEENDEGEDSVERDGEDDEDYPMREAGEEDQLPPIKKLKIAD